VRSYGQYCALAKALDLVGDRWTLLIVRELALRGGCRYTDLRDGLPGIATNMLADRLREMEEAGIVRREAAPPPVATTLFHLTDRGQELMPALFALGRWGAALMGERRDDDEFRTHWLRFPIEELFTDATPDGPPVTIELRTGDEPMAIEAAGGVVRAHPGSAEAPDAIVAGDPDVIVGFLTGRFDLRGARRRGLKVDGDAEAVRRIQPKAADTEGDTVALSAGGTH
jgi:DNA-binding HxlR family transcriptional regulator